MGGSPYPKANAGRACIGSPVRSIPKLLIDSYRLGLSRYCKAARVMGEARTRVTPYESYSTSTAQPLL